MSEFSAIIDRIRLKTKQNDYKFTIHALERCIERNIDPGEIRKALLSGEIIEYYPDDKYGPTCLIRGQGESGMVIHVNCSIDPVWIITVYNPALNPGQWDNEFKRRRR